MLLPDKHDVTATKPIETLVADLDVRPLHIRQPHMGPQMPPTQDPVKVAAQIKTEPAPEDFITKTIALADWDSIPETLPEHWPPIKKRKTIHFAEGTNEQKCRRHHKQQSEHYI